MQNRAASKEIVARAVAFANGRQPHRGSALLPLGHAQVYAHSPASRDERAPG
jgi:hypothetical protein